MYIDCTFNTSRGTICRPDICSGGESAQSISAQATMGRTDLFVSGWDISPEDVAICRASEDGSSICLGSGQFGKARLCIIFPFSLSVGKGNPSCALQHKALS